MRWLRLSLIPLVLAFILSAGLGTSIKAPAQLSMMGIGPGGMGGGAVAFSLTWTDGVSENSGGTTITYSGRAFGAANTNRIVAVFIAARMATVNAITSVTIGGVVATPVAGTAASVGGTNGANCQIWQAAVPAGTTGDVVVTFGAATARTGISIYRIVTGTPTATSADIEANAAAGSFSIDLTIPSSGGGIAGAWETSSTGDITWTNATQDFEDTAGAASRFESASTTTPGAVSIQGSFGSTSFVAAGASWGP